MRPAAVDNATMPPRNPKGEPVAAKLAGAAVVGTVGVGTCWLIVTTRFASFTLTWKSELS